MFDPTVYDNVKVVLEGDLYELDFLKKITITKREDIVDLASMSRLFRMDFKTVENEKMYPFASIQLQANLTEFKQELLENDIESTGCDIQVDLYLKLFEVSQNCEDIKKYLNGLWSDKPTITQKIYYQYETKADVYCKVSLYFDNKIKENTLDNLKTIINNTFQSLQQLTLRYGD